MSWARTTALRTRVGRLLGAAERLAGTRRGALVLVVAALAVYAFESVGWPLQEGRDLGVYLRYYVQIGQPHPVFPWAMLSRTPLTPVVAGLLLSAGGGLLAEVVMAVLFALSVLAWSAVAFSVGGRRTALGVAVALLVYPGYGGLFHELSSDAVFAASFAGWAFLLSRALQGRAWPAFAAAGAGLALLALARPANQALLVIAPLLMINPGSWRQRIARAAAFVATAGVLLLVWAGYNDVRYDDFTVARGGATTVADVARTLRNHGPGRKADELPGEIDPDGSGFTVCMHRRESHSQPLYVPARPLPAVPGPHQGPGVTPATVVVGGKRLPKPSEGEPIPAAHQGDYVSTPDGHIREVWRSAIDHGIVFPDARDQRRYVYIERHAGELGTRFPTRRDSGWLRLQLNHASKAYPRPWMWLLIGVIGLAVRRPRGWPAPVVLAASALVVILVTVLGVYAVPEYSVPVAPAFIMLAAVGWLGTRTMTRRVAETPPEKVPAA